MAVPSPAPFPADKPALRRAMRVRRRLAAEALGTRLVPVPEGFDALITERRIVAAYVAVGSEADPALLVSAACAVGLTIAYPHVVSREAPIRFVADNGAPHIEGPFGLRQPAEAAMAVDPDLVLVPLLAYDGRLHRLGQGAGHYDRALAALPEALRIGVAFTAQEVELLPADPWDEPLDAIITEAGLRRAVSGS